VRGIGEQDGLRAGYLAHYKLVAARRLQALQVVLRMAVLGALRVARVKEVAQHHRKPD
jgi:hypothetical protein